MTQKNESIKGEIKQFGILSILFYHLLPGIPILLFAILFSHPIFGIGLPIFPSLMLSILFGLIPVQLGLLAFAAKREGKKIKELIPYTRKMPVVKLLVWSFLLLLFSRITFIWLSDIEASFWTIFDRIPTWFRLDRFSFKSCPPGLLWLTIGLGFLLNGLLGPIVEELYFRGFLLPRMNILGKWAPFINTVLFSAYHFFSPWQNITRIIALTPYVYAVWAKKNIFIGIIVHCTVNTIGMIMTLITFVS